MYIELNRAHTPEECAREEACEICGQRFVVGSVEAQICDDLDMILGLACPACVEALGRRNPQRFPTSEELAAAKLRFPGPLWPSVEEATRAWDQGPAYHAIMAATRINRAGGGG